MPAPDIVLTEDEQRLFDAIRFDWDRQDHQAFARNGEATAALMKSLLTRGGIPNSLEILYRPGLPDWTIERLMARSVPPQR